MSVEAPAKPRRLSWPLMLALLACAALGLALDLTLDSRRAFFVAALPGGRALIGVGAALIALGASWAGRLLLTRAPAPPVQREDDAGDHA